MSSQKAHGRSYLHIRTLLSEHHLWLIMNDGHTLPYDWSLHNMHLPRTSLYCIMFHFGVILYRTCGTCLLIYSSITCSKLQTVSKYYQHSIDNHGGGRRQWRLGPRMDWKMYYWNGCSRHNLKTPPNDRHILCGKATEVADALNIPGFKASNGSLHHFNQGIIHGTEKSVVKVVITGWSIHWKLNIQQFLCTAQLLTQRGKSKLKLNILQAIHVVVAAWNAVSSGA